MKKITKKDIAKEQLLVAIRLFFYEDCPCSVHTLVSAALGILKPILRKENKDYYLNIDKLIAPGMIKVWNDVVNKQANFLKHADRDPEDILEYNEKQTKFQLAEAINIFTVLYKENEYTMMVYWFWFAASFPEIFTELKDKQEWLYIEKQLKILDIDVNNLTKKDARDLIDANKNSSVLL